MKILLTGMLGLFFSLNLFAHNVVGGVYVSGFDIEGEAGFSNGAMATAGTVVKVFDQAGIPLGEVETDAQGFFVFPALKRINHLFEINMGAGHTLKMLLPAEELPERLGESTVQVEQVAAAIKQTLDSNVGFDELLFEKMLARQIKPLRQEIQMLKEKAGLRDLMGGIGYIFGLLGLVMFLRERKNSNAANKAIT